MAIHKTIWAFAWRAFAGTLTNRFVEESSNVRTTEQSLDLALSFKFMGVSISPFQIREEIEELLKHAQSLSPHTILEIGTASGGTMFLFTRIAADDAEVISVDLPEGEFGGGYPVWKSDLFRSFAIDDQQIHLVRADSHDPRTLERIHEILGNRPVDLLFIDGDHQYGGVKRDFEMYSPLVRRGGIIAFHDVWPGHSEEVGGVPAFWKELSKKHEGKLIVKDRNQRGCGIGVLVR